VHTGACLELRKREWGNALMVETLVDHLAALAANVDAQLRQSAHTSAVEVQR
jgi:hypothetical protein